MVPFVADINKVFERVVPLQETVRIEVQDNSALESVGLMSTLLDNTFAFLCMICCDGTVIEANQVAVSLASDGRCRDQVVGVCFADAEFWFSSAVDRNSARRCLSAAVRGVASSVQVDVGGKPFDLLFKPVSDESGVVVVVVEGRCKI